MVKNNLHQWLKLYSKFQNDITLCSRESATTWWGNRIKFLDDDYNNQKFPHYNHRAVLDCEIVIEYDNPDKELNKRLINVVEKRLEVDGVKYATWYSGGKSYHCHVLIDRKSASRVSLLKKAFIRYYGVLYLNGKNKVITLPEYKLLSGDEQESFVRVMPDIRLADNNHLVRAEYGLHEHSGNHKSVVKKCPDYGVELSVVPVGVWQEYSNRLTAIIKRDVTIGVSNVIDSDEVKLLLSTTNFKSFGDGKKRVLFILINLLKQTSSNPNGRFAVKSELVDFLWDWYKYVGGYEFTKQSISGMVGYYWSRDYSRMGVKYIREVLEDIGVKNI